MRLRNEPKDETREKELVKRLGDHYRAASLDAVLIDAETLANDLWEAIHVLSTNDDALADAIACLDEIDVIVTNGLKVSYISDSEARNILRRVRTVLSISNRLL